MKRSIIFVLLILVIACGAGLWCFRNKSNTNSSVSPSLIAQVTYICNGGKTIDATFYQWQERPVKPGQPPQHSGSVKLVLSDGRTFNLPQTISADGARYANSDESFVFWSKGNGAIVLQNNIEKDYKGCIILAKDRGGLPKFYSDGTTGFSIRYPAGYSIDNAYKYQGLGPGRDINGVKFTISPAVAAGTNLSSFDTGICVEIIPEAQDCNAGLFFDGNVAVKTVRDSGIEYSFAARTEGAAGNFYDEQVWAISGSNSCIAMRYFIHSMNIGNYPEGAVKAFDRDALIKQFDKIRRSLTAL
jgi:membrane-bound inhibitor of C-type lysozyme